MLASLLGFVLLFVVYLYAQGMSDTSAMTKAKSIWGTNAAIGRYRVYGDFGWTYQVGCILSRPGAFIIAGQSKTSWDAAFQAVDMTQNGSHILTAVATDTSGLQTVSAPVQVFVCNPMVNPQ
jgi:hypothetical protein